MNNNVLGLLPHNQKSYKKVKAAYDSGEKVVGILHATGTGKTYNALQLALDNQDKQIIYVTPYNSIIEHVRELIKENPELSADDLLEFATSKIDKEKFEQLKELFT